MDFSDIGVTGIIALIVLAFAVIGFIKGLIRTVSSMICLTASGYSSLWVNENASDLSGSLIHSSDPWLPKIIAGIVGIVILFVGRYILKFIANPFDKDDKEKKSFAFGLPSALICLSIGLVILWAASSTIRYTGSLSEIRQTRSLLLSDESKDRILAAEPWLLKAKHFLDSSLVGKWQRKTDPFHSPGKLTLCQILIMYSDTETRVKMLTVPEIHQVLNNPTFIKLAFDEDMKNTIQTGQPKQLFKNQKVLRALEEEEFKNSLAALSESLLTSMTQSDTL